MATATGAIAAAATEEQMALSRSIDSTVNTATYEAVMATLKVSSTEIPLRNALDDTSLSRMFSLTAQLAKRHQLLEVLKNQRCSKHC